jgi:hypothetical protein
LASIVAKEGILSTFAISRSTLQLLVCLTRRKGMKGREGKGREGKGREGKGREGKGREGEKGTPCVVADARTQGQLGHLMGK